MGYFLIVGIILLLILLISLPLHVFIRKLSIRGSITDPKFWAATLSVSIIVAFIVNLENS